MSRYDAWISLVLPVLRCDMIGKLFADLRFHNQQNFLFPPGQIAHLHEITPTGTLMANQSAVSRDEGEELPEGATIPSLPPSGPRKLVRPSLPEGVKKRRSYSRRDTPLLIHQQPQPANGRAESTHAEAFYLQKQMHSQTHMIFMLESGDHVAGVIEWYDVDTIKVRHGSVRILIYKAAIKYLYKAADPQP
jgi:sRNA-binding regulator protein Hfq